MSFPARCKKSSFWADRSIDRRMGVGTMFGSSRRDLRRGPVRRAGSLTSHEKFKKRCVSRRVRIPHAEWKRVLNRDESKPEPSAVHRGRDGKIGVQFILGDGLAPDWRAPLTIRKAPLLAWSPYGGR